MNLHDSPWRQSGLAEEGSLFNVHIFIFHEIREDFWLKSTSKCRWFLFCFFYFLRIKSMMVLDDFYACALQLHSSGSTLAQYCSLCSVVRQWKIIHLGRPWAQIRLYMRNLTTGGWRSIAGPFTTAPWPRGPQWPHSPREWPSTGVHSKTRFYLYKSVRKWILFIEVSAALYFLLASKFPQTSFWLWMERTRPSTSNQVLVMSYQYRSVFEMFE